MRILPLALAAASLTACSDASTSVPIDPGTGGSGGSVAMPAPVEPLTYEACDWYTVELGSALPIADGTCARVAVPLWHDVPDGEAVEVLVKRLPALEEPRAQVWLLDGGPGGEGVSMELYAARWRERLPDVEFFVPQHRGVGQSTRLDCAGEAADSPQGFAMTEAEHIACADELTARWGDHLAAFSPTQAALDLELLVRRSQAERELPVTVFGSSYGTYLALRLAAQSDVADHYVLDSTCAPGHCWSADRDVGFDATAQRVFAACADNAECAARLGDAPWATVTEVLDDVGLACPPLALQGVNRNLLKVLLGNLLNRLHGKTAMPPLIARIQRCEPDDVAAVVHLVNKMFGGGPSPLAGHFGQALYANVVASEMYAPGTPDPVAIADHAAGLYAARGTTIFTSMLYQAWPRYTPPADMSTTMPSIDEPMLILHGGFDPLTPPATIDALRSQYGVATQTHVVFEGLGHGTVSLSVDVDDPEAPTCATGLVTAFIADPFAPVDASCTERTVPLAFEASAELSQSLFGRDSLWD